MWISPAFAQSFGDTSSLLSTIAPLPLIFVVLYFLLIRPQQQKAKEQRNMLSALRRGDRVVTGGGIIGVIAKVVSDEEVMVDIAEGIRVRVLRSTISSVLAKTEPVAAKGDKGKAKDGKGAEKDSEDAAAAEPLTVEAEGGDKPKGSARRAAGGK